MVSSDSWFLKFTREEKSKVNKWSHGSGFWKEVTDWERFQIPSARDPRLQLPPESQGAFLLQWKKNGDNRRFLFCYFFLSFLSSFVFPSIFPTFLLSFIPSFLCFSVCRDVRMYCVRMCALRPQVNTGIFLCCCPLYFMRAGLLLNVGLAELPPNVPQGSSYSASLALGIPTHNVIPDFSWGY